MSAAEDLVFSPATSIANGVRSGDVSARAITEATLARIGRFESDLHCFNVVTTETALAQADEVDRVVASGNDPGSLAGVPVALKDNICTRGLPTTAGSRILEGWLPPYDATVTTRLRAAGAVLVGKTNLDEFAMGSSTENSGFGPTRNPWDLDLVPGGSSGGSAAAVASGLAAIALGSDTGGSIRQPAALCGVVGMKPTYGGISRYGLIAFASSLDQIGPLARTVEDAAVMLEAVGGYDPNDSTSLEQSVGDLRSALMFDAAGLRVGVIADFLADAQPECAAAVRAAADALSESGAHVDDVAIPELMLGLPAYYLIAPAEASSNLARYDGVRYGLRIDAPDSAEMNAKTRAVGFGAEVKRRVMLGTYVLSAGYYDAYYAQAQRARTVVARAFANAYRSFDVLLAPTTPSVAFALGAKTDDPVAMYLSDLFTIPSNLAGHPAISVPYSLANGLPIGVQVLAPSLGENVMMRVAAALERSADPSARGPIEPNLAASR
ncbi:MAG: Asp-tRNA(Asn)/Glu-tRNA(Gln) amidotransferase subunit GatA [Acidimicrobiales bacterium]